MSDIDDFRDTRPELEKNVEALLHLAGSKTRIPSTWLPKLQKSDDDTLIALLSVVYGSGIPNQHKHSIAESTRAELDRRISAEGIAAMKSLDKKAAWVGWVGIGLAVVEILTSSLK